MTSSRPGAWPAGRWAPFLVGALGGAVLAVALLARGGGERILQRPMATPDEVAQWNAEGERRGRSIETFPDPPGEGPVVSARYWVSLPAYDMEVRRRGARLTLGIRGTDIQIGGGAWMAFGEGRIEGPSDGFRGAVATLVWSCVGLRFRGSADGVARIRWSADGSELETTYLQATALLAQPVADTYVKAYGRLARGKKPPYGAIRGQIPWSESLARLEADATVVVRGVVRAVSGEVVPDALVQLKGHDRTRVHADRDGRFELRFRGADAPWTQSISAGAAGYRNGETVRFTGDAPDEVVVELAPLPARDHRDYKWVHPSPDRDPDDVAACGTCHSWQYTEWLGSRHARSADHGHVLFHQRRKAERAPDVPDDCAACHQPAHAAATGSGLYQPRGLVAGNHCDFCHKISHVEDVRRPGVFGSLSLLRPDPASAERPGTIHHVFGPAPDVSYAYMGAAYNPLFATSHLCAGCHQGGGLPGRAKIDTFEEWRAWASARENDEFRSCQDCHMPGGVKDGNDREIPFIAWESLQRSPRAVHSHAFPGATPSLGKEALKLDVTKKWEPLLGRFVVEVVVENVGAGHAVPTGTSTKHVALGVWARQGDTWLAPDGGERADLVPEDRATVGPMAAGDWMRPPGLVFGWRRAGGDATPPDFYERIADDDLEDRRLHPGQPVTLRAYFVAAVEGDRSLPQVEVRVVHRRGAIGAGAHETPWVRHVNDPPPETEWIRILR